MGLGLRQQCGVVAARDGLLQHQDQHGVDALLPVRVAGRGAVATAFRVVDERCEVLLAGLVLVPLERRDALGKAEFRGDAQRIVVPGALDGSLRQVGLGGGLRDGQVPRSG
jgi:hypothetical protein